MSLPGERVPRAKIPAGLARLACLVCLASMGGCASRSAPCPPPAAAAVAPRPVAGQTRRLTNTQAIGAGGHDRDDDVHARLAALIGPLLSDYGHAGVVVGVVTPTGDHAYTFGRIGEADPHPPHAGSLFEIGSLTKVFTGLLLADMALRGEVALERVSIVGRWRLGANLKAHHPRSSASVGSELREQRGRRSRACGSLPR